MSIFGTILSKIFGHHDTQEQGQAQAPGQAQQATAQAATGGTQAAPAQTAAQPAQATSQSGSAQAGSSQPMQAQTARQPGSSSSAAPAQSVDVEAVLTRMAAGKGQTLNWRTSIVDLMKLLDLDSSLHARQQLAQELHYSGDMNDSAAMNIWLHKEVMRQLAANGGKVPDDLKH
jgi:hypothetical protein